MTTGMYRQGDLLLIRVDAVPEGRRVEAEHGRLILARGEVTGHHHSVAVADAELIDGSEGVFLRIMAATGTGLEHQEHATVTLEPGVYEVRRQVEYEPGELPRQVAD